MLVRPSASAQGGAPRHPPPAEGEGSTSDRPPLPCAREGLVVGAFHHTATGSAINAATASTSTAGPFFAGGRPPRRAQKMILVADLVRVFGPSDRGNVEAVTRQLQQLGISAVVLPSDQRIGTWQTEVPAADVATARAITLRLRARLAR